MEIKCDKCGAVSAAVTPETYMEGDIEFTFFRCPACGEIYPICATDSVLRKDIAGYRQMRMVIKNQKVTEKFIRNAEALKKRNIKRTQELMAQHPLAPSLLQAQPE